MPFLHAFVIDIELSFKSNIPYVRVKTGRK